MSASVWHLFYELTWRGEQTVVFSFRHSRLPETLVSRSSP